MSLKKLGRYDLIRVLGKGAMGLVYEGRDPNLDRRVAIKTIRVENLSEEAAAEYEVRFRTEARSAARLQHPNIVSVYDSDRDDEVAYLVMEFIQGDDLKHHLDQGKQYTLQESMNIMADLLSALEYAHRQNIVHRDIKPANLLIEANGRVKLADFGVARIQDSGEKTRTQGTMVGTLKYMSPEQVQGQPVDARADLFAAGIILYQLVSGSRPFDGENDFATIQQIVGHTPAAPTTFNPALPLAMDAVVAKALSKSRDQRYATAQEFASALKRVSDAVEDLTIVVPPANKAARGRNATWTGTVRAGEALVGLHSSIGLTSTVTQELELVYWKDIKDSVDAEDIQVFLDKFPIGIYADLARRRLKKLASSPGDETDIGLRSGTGSLSMSLSATPAKKSVLISSGTAGGGETTGVIHAALNHDSATALLPEKPALSVGTSNDLAADSVSLSVLAHELSGGSAGSSSQQVRLPRRETLVETTAASAIVSPSTTASLEVNRAAPPAKASPPEAVRPNPIKAPSHGALAAWPPGTLSKRLVWALGGIIVALAVAATGFKLVTGPGQPPNQAIIESAVVAPTAPASIWPDTRTETVAKVTQVPIEAAAVAAVDPAAIKASAALAIVKKAERDKDRLTKPALTKASAASMHPGLVPEVATVPVTADFDRNLPAVVVGSVNNPRAACENKVFLVFQICIAEQCAKSAFAQHPFCVERRATEQRRRDAEQLLR